MSKKTSHPLRKAVVDEIFRSAGRDPETAHKVLKFVVIELLLRPLLGALLVLGLLVVLILFAA